MKRTATGLDAQGKPIMQGGPEGTSTPWDGEDHAASDPALTVAVRKVNEHTAAVTVKRQGKIVNRDRSVVSKDGKTLTGSQNGTNEKDETVRMVEVFDRQ